MTRALAIAVALALLAGMVGCSAGNQPIRTITNADPDTAVIVMRNGDVVRVLGTAINEDNQSLRVMRGDQYTFVASLDAILYATFSCRKYQP